MDGITIGKHVGSAAIDAIYSILAVWRMGACLSQSVQPRSPSDRSNSASSSKSVSGESAGTEHWLWLKRGDSEGGIRSAQICRGLPSMVTPRDACRSCTNVRYESPVP